MPRRCQLGLAAHDAQRLALRPEVGHQAVAGLLAEKAEDGRQHVLLGDLSDARAPTTLTLESPSTLLLHELEIGGRRRRSGTQHLFQQGVQVAAEEMVALRRSFS